MLGLRHGVVMLCGHDDGWEEAARETIGKLKGIFGDTAVGIEHVGSTAIKGICAKPILDIAVGVALLGNVEPLIPALEKQGFIRWPENDKAWQIAFCRRDGSDAVTHHIQVVRYGSVEWNRYLSFRDYLNQNRRRAKEYEALKLQLTERCGAYAEGKSAFIRRVTEEAEDAAVLGRSVTVTVDRPLGSRHPRFPDTVYPVNYGCVKGVPGGDGMEQDAYVLGVKEPVLQFTGTVCAVIRREDDTESKWVTAPDPLWIFENEIRAAVDFQERYFKIHMRCSENCPCIPDRGM